MEEFITHFTQNFTEETPWSSSTHLLGLETYTRLELLRESQSHLRPQNKPCRCQLSIITSNELPSQLWKEIAAPQRYSYPKALKNYRVSVAQNNVLFCLRSLSLVDETSVHFGSTVGVLLGADLLNSSYSPAPWKAKMSVRKVTKQLAVSRVYCSMLFQFFGSGASLDIKLRPHCCSLSFAIFSLETWQLLKEHHQMIACDQEFDSDTVCLIQV